MSQLARREIAPHRAAFVTSLSRWYIRRLLGNLPPFHPCLSAERRPRIVPYGTSPHYGHTPRKSRHSKPFLPSYQCIRNWSGLSAAECPITGDVFCVASSPGIASDRRWPTRSRAITTTQPTHTHSFSGQLVSTALSGTAAGQRYSSTASLSVSGTAAGTEVSAIEAWNQPGVHKSAIRRGCRSGNVRRRGPSPITLKQSADQRISTKTAKFEYHLGHS